MKRIDRKSGRFLSPFRQVMESKYFVFYSFKKNLFSLMRFKFVLVTFLLFFMQVSDGYAQIGMMVGTNYSNIRHENRLEMVRGQMSIYFGLNVEVIPIKGIQNLSLKSDFILIQKGYTLRLNESKYRVNLEYGSFAPMIKYAYTEDFSVHSGVEFNLLTGANVGEDGTFRKIEKAFFFGLDLFNSKRLSFYTRASFGLTPVLDYYDIDPIEGIQGRISDLYTTTIMLGLQFNIYNEKIRF